MPFEASRSQTCRRSDQLRVVFGGGRYARFADQMLPMESCRGTPSLDALRVAYGDLAALAVALDEQGSWRPTGCTGWCVRDIVHHLLGDAQRALVALATPAAGRADRTSATYWTDSPGAPDEDSRGIRATRTMASQWSLKYLTATYAETASAVITWPNAPHRTTSSPPRGMCSRWTTCSPHSSLRPPFTISTSPWTLTHQVQGAHQSRSRCRP